MATAKKGAQARGRIKRADRKNISVGQAHIKSTFNNTIISITDPQGNVISWRSAGMVGFKGSRKSTPRARARVARRPSAPSRLLASRFRASRTRPPSRTTVAVRASVAACR